MSSMGIESKIWDKATLNKTLCIYITITQPTMANSSSPWKVLMAVLSSQNYLCHDKNIHNKSQATCLYPDSTLYIFVPWVQCSAMYQNISLKVRDNGIYETIHNILIAVTEQE